MKQIFKRWLGAPQTHRLPPDTRGDPSGELVALASDLAGEDDFESLMTRLCIRTRKILGCDRCSIFLLEDDGYRVRFNAGNPPNVAREFLQQRVPLDDPFIRRAIETRQQVTINTARNESLMNLANVGGAGVPSLLVAPLLDNEEEALGFITAEFNETQIEDRSGESELLGGIANIAALAIGRYEARRELDLIRSRMSATSSLAALGRFAGSIAHDFNNRLTVIVGTAEVIAEKVRGTEIEADLEELLRAAEASAGITQRLFDLSTGRLDRDAACSASSALTGIHGLLRRLVPEDIDLSIGVHDWELNVGLDQHDLERVITTLVVNLVEACEPGTGIHVDAKPVELGTEGSSDWAMLAPGSYAEISVRYSGGGTDPEMLASFVAPLESERIDSAGLSIAIVSSLVQDVGGAIRVDSNSGNGSRLVLLLPCLKGSLQEDFDRRQEPSLSGTVGTILLVDDDEPVRRLVRRSLRARGHKVIEAGSGIDALEIVEGYEGDIDVLLSDIVMPGMSGIELANAVARDRPKLQVLFMSGYAPGIRGEADLESANSRFVPKPFSTARIAEAVDSCFPQVSRLH